jgi:hypothetical protein
MKTPFGLDSVLSEDMSKEFDSEATLTELSANQQTILT